MQMTGVAAEIPTLNAVQVRRIERCVPQRHVGRVRSIRRVDGDVCANQQRRQWTTRTRLCVIHARCTAWVAIVAERGCRVRVRSWWTGGHALA